MEPELKKDEEINNLPPKRKPTREEAIEWLMGEIKKGEDSMKNEGWFTIEESRRHLGV